MQPMKKDRMLQIEHFFKKRPKKDASIIQKMLLSHSEQRLEHSTWAKELSRIVSTSLDNNRIFINLDNSSTNNNNMGKLYSSDF